MQKGHLPMVDNKDTSSKFFANMKKKGSILKKTGNEEAVAGYTTNADIIKAFGLKLNGKTTTQARCTSARVGVDKNGNNYASFNFVCTGSIGKGQTPNKYIELAERGNRTEEQAYRSLSFTLQNMGYSTKNLSEARLKDIIDSIKTDKPLISITIERWSDEGLEVTVNRKLEDDDEVEDSEDEEESEEDEESEDEDSDDSEEESEEEESEDEEEEEEDSLESPEEWIGSKATVQTKAMPKPAKVTLLSYNPKTKIFKAKNTKGESFNVKLDEVSEVH